MKFGLIGRDRADEGAMPDFRIIDSHLDPSNPARIRYPWLDPVDAVRQAFPRDDVATAVEAFGFDRMMLAGDWPVATQAIAYGDWVALLDRALDGVPEADRRKVWRGNAAAFDRLGS